MFRVVERYQDSSLTQSAFCQAESLALSTFQYWLSQYEKCRPCSSDFAQPFVEVQAQSPKAAANAAIVLSYPNGVSVSLSHDVELTLLKELITL
jgi:hypothetical protein